MHLAVYRFAYSVLNEYGMPRTVIDLGGRNCNGTLRDLFPNAQYTAVDIVDGEGVDVVCDAADYHHPTLVECVVCTEVLEHSPRAREIVTNAFALLKRAGLLILTCAGPDRPPHGSTSVEPLEGEFYKAVDPEEIKTWSKEALIGNLTYDPGRGDIYAWAIKR